MPLDRGPRGRKDVPGTPIAGMAAPRQARAAELEEALHQAAEQQLPEGRSGRPWCPSASTSARC